MEIYTDGNVYGIKWETNDKFKIVYEKKENKNLNKEQIKEIKNFYDQIIDYDLLCFYIYVKCTSKYKLNLNNFMCWITLTKLELDGFFNEKI